MGRLLPKALIDAAISAYVAGESPKQIKERLGVLEDTLWYHVRTKGIPRQGIQKRLKKRPCKWCEREIWGHRKKFCDEICGSNYRQELAREIGAMPECKECGAEMWKSKKLYCCDACKEKPKQRRREEIQRLLPILESVQGVADYLGITEHAVRYSLRGVGLPRQAPKEVSQARRDAVIRLRKRGLSHGQIAQKLKTTPAVVYGHAFRAAKAQATCA